MATILLPAVLASKVAEPIAMFEAPVVLAPKALI